MKRNRKEKAAEVERAIRDIEENVGKAEVTQTFVWRDGKKRYEITILPKELRK